MRNHFLRVTPRKNRHDDDSGFTLVEMVIAIMVLSLVALLAFPFFARSLIVMDLNNTTTHAVNSAQAIIENLRSDPTCANVNNIRNNVTPFHDGRGVEYIIELNLETECVDASLVEIEVTATRTRDAKRLFTQDISLLVLSPGAYFEVNP